MADHTAFMIDTVFMERLLSSKLYGDPPEGLADRLKERCPDRLTEQALVDAADQIIRTHGSGAFPKFPECNRAIEEAVRRSSAAKARPGAGFTKETYFDAALRTGRYYVIHKRDREQWLSWRAYFASLGLRWSVSRMDEPDRGEWCVPAEMPQQFDTSFRAPMPLPEPPRRMEMSFEERANFIRRFGELVAGLQKPALTRRHRMSHSEITQVLDAAAENEDRFPAAFTAETAARLGLSANEEAS